MTYKLATTPFFEKRLKKFHKRHPELGSEIARTFRDLEKDPFQPHLKLHPLKGHLKGLFAVSITYDYRITLTFVFNQREILLLDVGSHDEVYR